MRREMIETYIKKLSLSLGGVRVPIDDSVLWNLHNKKDLSGMTRYIRDTFGLRIRIILGLVARGGPKDALAWVESKSLPMYGTPAFNHTTVVMHIRKSKVLGYPFEIAVYSIAHELSHVLLRSLRHELRNSEEATDLTAMILGYREFYRFGREYLIEDAIVTKDSEGNTIQIICKPGYLSLDEIKFANNILRKLQK